MKETNTISLGAVILNGLCAAIWILRAILAVVSREYTDSVFFFVLNVLCAVIWSSVFVKWLVKYRGQKNEEEWPAPNGKGKKRTPCLYYRRGVRIWGNEKYGKQLEPSGAKRKVVTEHPSRPIFFANPYPPRGAVSSIVDILARTLGQRPAPCVLPSRFPSGRLTPRTKDSCAYSNG